MLQNRAKLSVVDLFAGAGGFSCGFEQTGCFNVILAVEKEPHFRQTYRENHRNVDVRDDILDLIQDDKLPQLAAELKEKYGGVDVVIGGPPCQGFSKANRQRNHLISTNNMLVTAYVKVVDRLRPRVFIMENVADMPKYDFFVSSNDADQVALELSGVSTQPWIGLLGKVGAHAATVVRFLRAHLTPDGAVAPPLCSRLVTEVYPPLKTLSNYVRKDNTEKAIRFLTLNASLFARIQQRVGLQPSGLPKYLHAQLGVLIEHLRAVTATGGPLPVQELCLVEAQLGILARFDEIAANRIKVLRFTSKRDGSVFAHLESYNLATHLEDYFRQKHYRVQRKVLEASDYGVPQRRERVFFIGVREDIADSVPFPEPLTPEHAYSVRDAILDLEAYTPSFTVPAAPLQVPPNEPQRPPLARMLHGGTGTVYNHVQTTTTETALERYAALSQGQNFLSLPAELQSSYANPGRTQRNIYRRLVYAEPSLTVTNVRKAMWIHPQIDRAISIREAARLQSFPDSYRFYGRKNDQYQQVGNAVPPLLARAVGEVVANLLGQTPIRTLQEDLDQHRPEACRLPQLVPENART